MSYKKFTEYYDEIVRGGEYSLDDEVAMIGEFIEEFGNGENSILEYACGSGVIAGELQKKGYEVYGIDMSISMLEKARKNMGEKNCKIGDMTTYQSERKYDCVLCNYNSICHLTSWEEWQACMRSAHNNLKPGGLFIFDINTVGEFENITRDFAQFYNIGEDTVCLEMQKNKGLFEWIVKMFIKNESGSYDCKIEKIPELSFEINAIQGELEKIGFRNLHLEDFHKGKVDEESERVYFIAEKI